MNTRIDHILQSWYPERDNIEWVVATIINTERSVYRKAGAMMFVNELGESLGILSGGCLEGDIRRLSKKVLTENIGTHVSYDFDPASDVPWQKGLGCGGAVQIHIQTINQHNQYLGFAELHHNLLNDRTITYHRRIDNPNLSENDWNISKSLPPNSFASYKNDDGNAWCSITLKPKPTLLIIGGGVDAQPLATIAHTIGWGVSVLDERVGYAKPEHFPNARCYQIPIRDIEPELFASTDAVVIMQHNVNLDALALNLCKKIQPRYIGLLGPAHRRERVEAIADLSQENFTGLFKGPTGFDIGASLPETIALSICAEIHQVIEGNGQTELISSLPTIRPLTQAQKITGA